MEEIMCFKYGQFGKDWQEGVNFERLRRERLEKTREAMQRHGLGALIAFTEENIEILEKRRNEFQKRRDYLLPELKRLGFDISHTPKGAFYLYANIGELAENSVELANRLLEQAKVAVTPGIDFGSNQPQKYIRFAYTTSLDKLKEGVSRIEKLLVESAVKNA